MLLFSLLLLFLFACLGGWMLLFPDGRDALLASAWTLAGRAWRRWSGAVHVLRWRPRGLGAQLRTALARAGVLSRRHRWVLTAVALLLFMPPLLALLASGRLALPGFDEAEHQINDQVTQLLKGEQLAPPPPLPPLVFTTAEVTLVRPMLEGASRNWRLLDADFEQRLLLVFRIMRERYGYEMALLEGYRSPQRQDLLASAGSAVTNARAFQSYHQFGLAADCAFLREGKLLISEKDPWTMRGYRLYGETAEAAGLTWGGRWRMMDFGHTELRTPGALARKR